MKPAPATVASRTPARCTSMPAINSLAISCGFRRNVRASVMARFVVQSPNAGSRGRSTTGSMGPSAPSERAAWIRASRMIVSGVTRPRTFRRTLIGGRLRTAVAFWTGLALAGVALGGIALAGFSRLTLILLAVLAVIRDVETGSLEEQAGAAGHDPLSLFTAFRTLHPAFGGADRAKEVLELVALRAAVLVRWHYKTRRRKTGDGRRETGQKSLLQVVIS